MALGRYLILAVVGTMLSMGPAWADTPMDEIRAASQKGMKILQDPVLKRDAMVRERRAAIGKVVEPIFDFREMARRALGLHWRDRTEVERAQFTALFMDLLERTYISRIELYSGERVIYVGESMDGDYATVRTKIITKHDTEVPVNYWMLRREGRWMVYDVEIEDVSLVDNYRTQFNDIIGSSSYGELVKRIKAKLEKLKVKEEAKAQGASK